MAPGTATTRSGTATCRPTAPTDVESALLPPHDDFILVKGVYIDRGLVHPLDDSILVKGVYIDRGLVHPLDDSILVKEVYRQGPGAPTG